MKSRPEPSPSGPDPAELLAATLERLRPTAAERRALDEAIVALLGRADDVADSFRDENQPHFEPLLVGSAAKDTWLHGSVDLDVFLLFDEDLERADLERAGLEAGRRIMPEPTLRYAEHPYVHGTFQGYPADVVPAHRVADPEAIKSAVDRTPYHNAYVLGALAERPALKDDVRLAKAFLQGIGCYGAETALGAVSGYLTEVFVLEHGSFVSWIEHAARAGEPWRIDPTGRSKATFPGQPLVVIDPVDATRNAAAAVTRQRLQALIRAARAFVEAPHKRFFEPVPLPRLTCPIVRRRLGDTPSAGDGRVKGGNEGGDAVVVTVPVPEMREDARVPHARRAAENLAARLQADGFGVLLVEGGVDVDDARLFMFVETAQRWLPAERDHWGPPEGISARGESFCRKYDGHPNVMVGPEVRKNAAGDRRWYVRLRETRRELTERTEAVLRSRVALGKHVDAAVGMGPVTIRRLEDAIDDDALEKVLRESLATVDPWERTGKVEHDLAPRRGH